MTTRHILIVDDEPRVAFFLGKALERSSPSYSVTTAYSGEEALKILSHTPVDLLITDQRMPGISGLELIRQVQTSDPQIRTILITAYGSDEIEAEVRRLEVGCYITKPFDIKRFIDTVQKTLLMSNGERALAEEHQLRNLLISLIFHELRTPMTFVMSYADLLAEQSMGLDQELAQNIVRHTLRMKEVLDDITLLTELNIEQMPRSFQPVNLTQMLETTIAQLTPLAAHKHQTVQITPTAEPIWVTNDSYLLGVMLTCLISNAIKNAPKQAKIWIDTTQEGEVAMVTVRRSNNVASVEDMEMAEPGVGLTVARSLAEALGGNLQIEPEVEGSTVVCLAFPINLAPQG